MSAIRKTSQMLSESGGFGSWGLEYYTLNNRDRHGRKTGIYMKNKNQPTTVDIERDDALGCFAKQTTTNVSAQATSSFVLAATDTPDDFDNWLAVEAAKRLAKDDGTRISFDEILEKYGIALDEIQSADVNFI